MTQPTFERLGQYSWAFGVTRSLATAVEIGLFTRIAEGRRTIADLATACRASQRGVRMLADALTALGLCTKEGQGDGAQYGLAADAEVFLVAGKPGYVGEFILFHAFLAEEHWRRLTDCVLTGRPILALDRPQEGVPFWHKLVDCLFGLNYPAAQRVGQELATLYPGQPVRLLDVACGSGVWGFGAATANPRVQVTSQDLPETLEHARQRVTPLGLVGRVAWLAGDLRTLSFGEGAFDAAVLGHICHSEGAQWSRKLIAKVGRALRPGGTLVICEFLPDPQRAQLVVPLLFALNMLVHTSEGDTYTVPEYTAWLAAAGFADVRTLNAPAPAPLILATRK
jgi:ubiquinone/menaquinone biosynthesis C-methylase UbiE